MFLSNKNILIISPEPWDHIYVSKHHYGITLAERGNQVYFLNPPTNKLELVKSEINGLKVVNYNSSIKGLRYLPKKLRGIIENNMLGKIERVCNCRFDIIWSFDNSVFYDFDTLPARILSISHIVDLNQNFQIERASNSADICIGVTDEIVDKHRIHNSNSYKIGHGLSLATSTNKQKIVLPGGNPIKALYLGNLAMKYIDWKIMLETAKETPEVDFIFIGPNGKNIDQSINDHHKYKSEMFNLGNAFFMPRISSNEILSYLEMADILLLSYQEAHHVDQSNAHKILEYLASGKTIVGTFTKEYENKDELILMSKSNDDWKANFKNVANELPYWNSVERQTVRRNYAMSNSYERRVTEIENILTTRVYS